MPKHRPSMAEVAKSIGVSHQTVSRVINGSPNVKPATRKKVEQAIADLGYHRNNAARTLVTKKSGLIGVIALGSFLYGPTSTLAALEESARENDFNILLSTISKPELNDFKEAIHALLNRSVEAIVIIATKDKLVQYAQKINAGIPVILVGSGESNTQFPNILGVDQEEGGRIAVRHLAGLGHRKIWIMTGPEDWVDALQRLKGASSECTHLGIKPHIVGGSWDPQSGYELGVTVASKSPEERPTAIIMPNDSSSLGLLLAFSKSGIKVPRDISVVGFDDIPESKFFSTPLTTVKQDFTELGRQVMQSLLKLLNGENTITTTVTPTLSLRASTQAIEE